jgi:TDG/mug DNA glycosylase family protein
MGSPVETLADLVPTQTRLVSVGINPAPISVAAGHYYQGALGRRLFDRLRQVGLLPAQADGWDDDEACKRGVGFTDIVKRPTRSSSEVSRAELRHGAEVLAGKLARWEAPLVVFAFKNAATQLLGRFDGNGFVADLRVGRSDVFVMPGPYESRQKVDHTLESLRQWLENNPLTRGPS